jgi:alanine racemase
MILKIWIEIDAERLAGNLAALRRATSQPGDAASELTVLGVVKADAYGHGVTACAPILARAGAEWLGVTDAQEGALVRTTLAEAGISPAQQPEILIMSGIAGSREEAELIVRHRLTPTVWDPQHLTLLRDAARRLGTNHPIPVHLELDTGMARQGVGCATTLARLLDMLKTTPELHLDGVFTHFASTEVAHSGQTLDQERRFEAAVAQIARSGLRPRWVHVGNSSFIDNAEGPGGLPWLRCVAAKLSARPMVRAGLALYGYLLPIEGAREEDASLVRAQVSPVMAWKTRVMGLRELEPGATVGYNGIFVADRTMRVALLPVGYADGLRRELSGSNTKPGGWVQIRGQRCPIVGRISMNLTMVDVSAIADVELGESVTLLGDDITADDHARLANTIAYEIVCGVKSRP